MKTKTETINSLQFSYLPNYAQYLLTHKLEAFVYKQGEIGKQLNIPLLQSFSHFSEQEFLEYAIQYNSDYLSHLAANDANGFIQKSIETWKANTLSVFDKYEVVAEDISLISYMRKKTFLHFLPEYCRDPEQMIQIIEEIDFFLSRYDIATTDTFIKLLEERVEHHSHFIEKINTTSPSAIYVFDLLEQKMIYTNGKFNEMLGFAPEERSFSNLDIFKTVIHPEDIQDSKAYFTSLKNIADKEVRSFKYRIKDKAGSYCWIRNYDTVFKRKEDNSVWQIIGVSIDVNKEKTVSDELRKRERQLTEAQALAHIGSWAWNMNTGTYSWSDEMYKIYELDKESTTLNYDLISNLTHPDDRESAIQQMQLAIDERKNADFQYRILVNGKTKYIHSTIESTLHTTGQITEVIGTSQDITERQLLLEKLKKSESLYKQAESLASFGNWAWDIETNKVEWTDQLYKIYGLEPQAEEITIARFLSFIHPDDKTRIEESLKNESNFDTVDSIFKIVTAKGEIKTLRSISQVQKNSKGQIINVIGTEQDITERETLIENLQHSDALFKQAEALAHIGSWSWNINEDKVIWTDELYRIYDIEPQSETIDFQAYVNLIHPEDRDWVIEIINNATQSCEAYQFTHRILLKDGSIRFIQSHGEVLKDKDGQVYKLIGTAQDITEQKLLLSRLEESEKRHKEAQRIARLGNWSYNVKTNETIGSEEIAHIYEIPAFEKMKLEDYANYIHPDDRDSALAYTYKCIQEKTPYELRHRIVLHNGKIKTVLRKGDIRLDKDGNVEELFGTTQDITEQIAIEHELKAQQIFIQKITDAAPSIITSYNVLTDQYEFINEGLYKLLGYHPKEVIGKGTAFFNEIIHPDDITDLLKKNYAALDEANKNAEENKILEYTYRMRHRNGSYRWFTTYASVFDRNQSGQVEHVLRISLDVTDQIHDREKIEEQELFIKQVADASPTILYLFDTEPNKFSYINHEIYYVLGYAPEEILAMDSRVTDQLYHPEDFHLLPERKQTNKKFQHSNSMMQYECRLKNKSGDWCWVLVREVIFKRNEKGQPVQILGAALDITKRKEMEKSLLQNAFQLEQSNASLEEFAYVASHDLKEPLRKITTFGDRIIQTQQERLSDDGKVYLKKIIDASHRMQIMINDLLSISMITGDRSFEAFSLQTILEEVKQTLEYKIEKQNAIIDGTNLPEASIVPSQFRQLFQNLLSNSLKFTREDVQPHIIVKSTYLLPEELGDLQLAKAPHYLKLEFIDNGIGFEEEYSSKIFQIFQRLHGRSEYEGTGIGLAICKKIAEHHSGVIYAKGQPGEGATFTIILPAS